MKNDRIIPLEGSLLDRINEYCLNQEFKADSFYKLAAKQARYPDHTQLKHELNRSFSLKAKSSKGKLQIEKRAQRSELERRYIFWANFFSRAMKVPYNIFEVPESNESHEKDLNGPYISEMRVLNLGTLENSPDISGEYLKILKYFLQTPLKELYVYDYLERHNFADQIHIRHYFHIHSQLFKNIELRLRTETDFKYLRVISLPVRIDIPGLEKLEFQEIVKYAVLFCSLQLFKHICRCLITQPKLEELGHESGFIIQKIPRRTYHYAIFDGGKHYLMEYYTYADNLAFIPNILQVGVGRGSEESFAGIHYKNIRDEVDSDNRLTYELLFNATKALANGAEAESIKLNQNTMPKYLARQREIVGHKWDFIRVQKMAEY